MGNQLLESVRLQMGLCLKIFNNNKRPLVELGATASWVGWVQSLNGKGQTLVELGAGKNGSEYSFKLRTAKVRKHLLNSVQSRVG